MRENFTELADQLRVQCLRETVVIPQRSTQGSIDCDISAACNCVIPSKGKLVIQTGLAISLPSGSLCLNRPVHSGLAVKKFIDLGAGLMDSDYWGEIGVVLFNHSAMRTFQSRWETGSPNSSLRRLKLPTSPKGHTSECHR